MFHMMNEARLGVGIQGMAMGGAAYQFALNYARERKQGKSLLQMMDPAAPPVAIIQHPDVRRMLMWMKAYVSGMRSFIYYVGHCFDIAAMSADESEREQYEGLIEILTPVVKAFCSDRSFDVCTQAVQVYGGYGYIGEYPVEQYLRDCKITSIFEGTNGIQAMDLLGIKIGMKKGKYFMTLLGEMQKTVGQAREYPELVELAEAVEKAVNRLGEVALGLGQAAMSPKVLTAFAFAEPFLDITGEVVMAWMHLWRAVAAQPKLEKMVGGLDSEARAKKIAKNKNAVFYDGQIKTARYFINALLPEALGKMDGILAVDDAVIEMDAASF